MSPETVPLCRRCHRTYHDLGRNKKLSLCSVCPYFQTFNVYCDDEHRPFLKWCWAHNTEESERYARQVLEEVKQLK